MKKPLYFVALVIDGPEGERITEIKKVFEREFNSSRALRSPPHITLIPPFSATDSVLDNFWDATKVVVEEYRPFSLEFNSFGSFKPRVIFIDVPLSPELSSLQHELSIEFKNTTGNRGEERTFHPHITVAFRDLTKEKFYEALPLFKDIKPAVQYRFNAVSLLHLEETGWKVIRKIAFPDS